MSEVQNVNETVENTEEVVQEGPALHSVIAIAVFEDGSYDVQDVADAFNAPNKMSLDVLEQVVLKIADSIKQNQESRRIAAIVQEILTPQAEQQAAEVVADAPAAE